MLKGVERTHKLRNDRAVHRRLSLVFVGLRRWHAARLEFEDARVRKHVSRQRRHTYKLRYADSSLARSICHLQSHKHDRHHQHSRPSCALANERPAREGRILERVPLAESRICVLRWRRQRYLLLLDHLRQPRRHDSGEQQRLFVDDAK